jgi:hypothetical protein
MEKTFFKTIPLTIGGAYYKKLASNDEALITETENTTFALLATEDFRDYYEAEGGYGFARTRFFGKLTAESGVLMEKHKWLSARRELWSLFGGSKRFTENFSTIEGDYRDKSIIQLDNGNINSIIAKLKFRTEEPEELFDKSNWDISAALEWEPDAWSSDSGFALYNFSIARHQSLGKESGISLELAYGDSKGILPINRKYFLGGLSTLHGYYHKEFMGEVFWSGNLEYGIQFPKSDLTGWAFYNVGQIADTCHNLGDAEVKHSLGIGISFEKDIRINIARRLDRSAMSPRIYVRLEHLF